MKTLGPKGLKLLRLIHVLLAIMWTGGACSMLLLLLLVDSTSAGEIYIHALDMKIIDDWVIIIGANGCLITGVIYGIFTKWGFFKHGWITIKWILTIFMIASGTFAMGPIVNGNVELGAEMLSDAVRCAELASVYNENIVHVVPWAIVQNVSLLIVIILSIYKPWKAKIKK